METGRAKRVDTPLWGVDHGSVFYRVLYGRGVEHGHRCNLSLKRRKANGNRGLQEKSRRLGGWQSALTIRLLNLLLGKDAVCAGGWLPPEGGFIDFRAFNSIFE